MATGLARSVIRDRIGQRTGKVDNTDFDTTADDGINQGFDEMLNRYSWREMCSTTTVSISAAATSATLTASTYDSITGARLRLATGPNTTYPFEIKTLDWINKHFPDRDRSGANTSTPMFGAICINTLELNVATDAAYTLYLTMDLESTFAALDASVNPVPLLNNALVNYGVHWVFESLGMFEESGRALQLYERDFVIAKMKDERRPGLTHRFIPRPLRVGQTSEHSDEANIFSLSQLQSVYS